MKLLNVGHFFTEGSWLFRGLDLVLQPGNVYALTGPSGSGKSTLLSMLSRLDSPREGSMEFDHVSRISWVFQNPHGIPRRSAVDHVILPLVARGRSVDQAEDEARALLRRFSLESVGDRTFRELSGGEAQRLMLARGMASAPDLLLVDEPTAQLDRATASQVDSVIGSTAARDTIVVVATHDSHTRDACTHLIDLAAAAPAPA